MTQEQIKKELSEAKTAMEKTETGWPIFLGIAGIVIAACGGLLSILGTGVILLAAAWYFSCWSGQSAAIERYNIAKQRADRLVDKDTQS
jgi:hypothetical protein